MPYINTVARQDMKHRGAVTQGELNYAVTNLVLEYIKHHGVSYGTFNDVTGALECAKLELHRRWVAPYEDHKREENGDVYPSDCPVKGCNDE